MIQGVRTAAIGPAPAGCRGRANVGGMGADANGGDRARSGGGGYDRRPCAWIACRRTGQAAGRRPGDGAGGVQQGAEDAAPRPGRPSGLAGSSCLKAARRDRAGLAACTQAAADAPGRAGFPGTVCSHVGRAKDLESLPQALPRPLHGIRSDTAGQWSGRDDVVRGAAAAARHPIGHSRPGGALAARQAPVRGIDGALPPPSRRMHLSRPSKGGGYGLSL